MKLRFKLSQHESNVNKDNLRFLVRHFGYLAFAFLNSWLWKNVFTHSLKYAMRSVPVFQRTSTTAFFVSANCFLDLISLRDLINFHFSFVFYRHEFLSLGKDAGAVNYFAQRSSHTV